MTAGRLLRGAGAWLAGTLLLAVAILTAGALVVACGEPATLPDLGPLTRFEFPTIGHVFGINGEPLMELARERRQITQYADIPPIVRDAMLAAEDKRFFSHDGVDYPSIPRVLGKVRLRGVGMFPQGGSTITQQLVRGVFLQRQTSEENGATLRVTGVLARVLSWAAGARNVNRLSRKAEEIRLSLWVERQMRGHFGSKRRAKEELFARYASFVYMGHGQYGVACAAEFYFGRPLSTFSAADAGAAALLAGIMKAPRDYAPAGINRVSILRRRNQILTLMAARGFISRDDAAQAERRPLPAVVPPDLEPFRVSAVIEHVLTELHAVKPDLGIEDLLQGHLHVYSTVDARAQRIASEALEHGLQLYEQRHPDARHVVQGSVVVLKNGDGSVLAETGGRQIYQGRATTYSDFNRVREALRQPGSTMKPIVYLAAFRQGAFSLDTLVPDEPISVPAGRLGERKWIANYDGRFKGLIPIREALAESRNAVAIWLTEQVGIDSVLQTARSLGVQTRLQRYPTTALGASEVNLLELANAYRAIASGIQTQPYVIRQIADGAGGLIPAAHHTRTRMALDDGALALIQEGLRGVVRIPGGTAHALDSASFPIAVMGKTGTTNDFKDALFVGSTYGADGVTVAVRIGFDDGRSLGPRETGGRVALPVFQEVMMGLYSGPVAGRAPAFPSDMEARITRYVRGDPPTEGAVASSSTED